MPEASRISVVIVDDNPDTRDNLAKLLYFERDIQVVGTAGDAKQAVDLVKKHLPHIVVMDVNMPGTDGIAAAEAMKAEGLRVQIILMSVEDKPDCLRRAMLAGAREFLIKPFTGEDLILTIRRVYERIDRLDPVAARTQPEPEEPRSTARPGGRILTVFSPKGGVGRTTVACNLALALKAQTGKEVVLVDCALQFGDVGVMLNLQPTKTIIDILPHVASLDADLFRELLIHHSSGIDVMLAPTRPEMAELVPADSLKRILSRLRDCFDYVVVDTWPSLHDTMLGVLDASDKILLVLTLEMPAIKNASLFLDVAQKIGYPPEKFALVLNQASSASGIDVADVQTKLGRPITARIGSDPRLATAALNQGVPFVTMSPRSPLSQSIFDLASAMAGGGKPSSNGKSAEGKSGIGGLARLFGRPASAAPGPKSAET